MKKAISVILTLAMILALGSMTVFAATTTVGTAAELASAITAAAAGDTIQLTADITGIQQMEISKAITIDMKGFDISGNPTSYTAFRVVAGGDLTLSNSGATQSKLLIGTGTAAEYNYEGIRIAGSGKATVGANVSIETGCPVFIYGNGTAGSAQLYVYGKLVVTDDLPDGDAYSAIQGNGTAGKGGTIINIYVGAVIENPYSSALYIPQSGVVNVFGGTITGKSSAIAIKSGTLNISGGTLSATGPVATLPPAGWSNGINASGCAIQIESNDSYSGNIIINITGGTIISANGYAIYEYLDTVTSGDTDPTPTTISLVNRISVSGGTLTSATGLDEMMLSAELTAKGVVTTDSTEVTADADVTYTVIIPSSVDFGTIYKSMTTQTRPFAVAVEDALIEDMHRIMVTNTTPSLMMKDRNGTGDNTLSFTLTGSYVFNAADLIAGNGDMTVNGTVSCNPSGLTAAGSYKGFMTFTIAYTEYFE